MRVKVEVYGKIKVDQINKISILVSTDSEMSADSKTELFQCNFWPWTKCVAFSVGNPLLEKGDSELKGSKVWKLMKKATISEQKMTLYTNRMYEQYRKADSWKFGDQRPFIVTFQSGEVKGRSTPVKIYMFEKTMSKT